MVFLAAAACASPAEEPAFTSSTEDGRTTAVTHRPEWSDVRPFRVVEVARFESDEAREALLGQVRGAALLSDGGVAVVDGRTGQVVDYDPTGGVRRVLGGLGDGPGDFRNPRSPTVLGGDSIAVYDGRANRVTVFAPDGTPTLHPLGDLLGAPPLDVWLRPGGRAVVFEGNRREAAPLATSPDGSTIGALAVIARLDLETGRSDTLHAEGIAAEMLIRGDMLLPMPFPRVTRVDALGGMVAVAPTGPLRLLRFGPDGAMLEARLPSAQRRVDPGEVARLRDSVRAVTVEADAPFVNEAAFHPTLQPELRPAFSAIRVAPDGRMLARAFEPLGGRSTVWWLVSREGRFRGRLQVPDDVDVLGFHGDRMLWLRRDVFDVPAVSLVRVDWSATLGEDGSGS